MIVKCFPFPCFPSFLAHQLEMLFLQVIPALLQVLSDSSCPRVQAHAGAALVNFFEDSPKHILTPYMDRIIKTLENVLTLTLKEVCKYFNQEQTCLMNFRFFCGIQPSVLELFCSNQIIVCFIFIIDFTNLNCYIIRFYDTLALL